MIRPSSPLTMLLSRHTRRREFIKLVGGAAAAWPLAARAQQGERMRRIGVLLPAAANDPEFQARMRAFQQGLEESGWSIGRNIQLDMRWTTPDAAKIRQQAAELVALAPDVIFATGGSVMAVLQQATRTLPIVFVQVPDPVGAGFVDSLARPGGNATGFTQFEYGVGAKLLELLGEILPGVKRAIVLRDPASPDGIGQFAAIQAVGPSLGVELRPIGVREPEEIERAITTIARESGSGLIVTASGLAILHRELIIMLATRHRLPAVYPYRFFVIDGGLISYGPSSVDPYRRAAGYVDRILKGEKAADLPVQAPTKYELVINLKTAKALGLEIPSSVLARADEVIE